MGILFATWAFLLGIVAVVWATRHLALNRAVREEKPLADMGDCRVPNPAPRVSVLVAAKDEEANIEACLGSLLDQDYPNFELIAINDRSTDRTPHILDRFTKSTNGEFKAIHVRELRSGWFGKNNAMRTGIEQADGEWLLLTDADCRQVSRCTLSLAVAFACERNIDFLSVLPVLETRSTWERIIQPVCAAIMTLWFQPRKVNDPQCPAAYANGAFMLIRRTVYDAIGGHEQVKTQVNEDMHMARLAKEQGFRLFVIRGDGLYLTRMYASLREAWRGWSRIFYGCFGSWRRLIISAAVLCFASLLPWTSLFVASLAWPISGSSSWRMIFGWALAAVLAQQTVLVRFYALARSDPRLAPTYIVGAFIALGMLINAMNKLRGSTTTWRGTTYKKHQLVKADGPEAPRR
jgi:chlorobactene glucosyltransferase